MGGFVGWVVWVGVGGEGEFWEEIDKDLGGGGGGEG